MDPRQHERYLRYLETLQYFRPPAEGRLKREEWLAYDRELIALEQSMSRGETSVEQRRLRKHLRRLLMRD